MKSTRASVVTAALVAAPLTFTALNPCAAQGGAERMIGPVIGMNRTTMGGSNGEADGYETRSGVYVGIQTQRQAEGRAMFFRSGVFVARRGGLQKDTSGGKRVLNLTYIEVPALVGLNLIRRPRLGVHALGGLQAGLELGCSFDVSGGGISLHTKCTAPGVDFSTKTYDFSFVAGGGLDFPRPSGRTVTLDVTYGWGFSTIDKTSSPGEYLNRGATFALGIKSPVRPKF